MTTIFNFLKSVTADGHVNSDKLCLEIAEQMATPVISTDPTSFVVSFSSDLTAQEETDLDSIVAAHEGQRYPYMLTGSYTDPRELDYDIMDCVKNRIMGTGDHKGELRTIEYYKNFNLQTQQYSDLAVVEQRRYYRDTTTGLVMYRLLDVDWYDTNGSVIATKRNILKLYSFNESRQENATRRTNIVNDAEAYLINTLIVAHGQATGFEYAITFLASVKVQKDLYIDGAGQPLLDAIAASALPFITQNIKDTLTTMITYDYTVSD